MENFGDVGVVCLNGKIKGVCQSCLWWEWDSAMRQCSNCRYPVCPMYREWLLSPGPPTGGRQEPRLNGELPPSGVGLEGPPGAAAKESGIG